jgi:anti-anti-sigma factor
MGSLSSSFERAELTTTVFLSGDLSGATSDQFVREMGAERWVAGENVEVDLAGVELIDSSGTAALVRVLDQVTAAGASMAISRPRRAVLRAITVAGVARVIPVGPIYAPGS